MNTSNNSRKGMLTRRQERFAEEYIQCGNATEAARRAGFVNEYAYRAMRQPAVQQYIKQLQGELMSDAVTTARETMAYLKGVMEDESESAKMRARSAEKLVRILEAILKED